MSYNIDKIFYINLNKRKDRREEIENELNNFGLNYERFEAIETPGFGIYGCGLSHMNVLKIAKERNYKNILILEDDFVFTVTKEEFEEELTKFFNLNIPYDVLKLSYATTENEPTKYDFINRTKYSVTASGYIVNMHYYNNIIWLYEWAMPLLKSTGKHWIYANDQIWRTLQSKDKWYYFKKRIGKQRPGFSDNTNGYVDSGGV